MTRTVTVLEPLYSMLLDMPLKSLQVMFNDLNDYKDESELDVNFQSLGVTRGQVLDQVKLAMKTHGINTDNPEQMTLL